MRQRLPIAMWWFAAAKIAFHLGTTRLEHHRDELYFISASKRLAFSYVDFQPVTPFLVRVARLLFGESLVGLRILPALAGATAVVLAALLAREWGADRRGQTIAGFALLVVPLFVGMDAAVNTASLETPAFMLVALLMARIARTNDQRWYIALGAAAGLALLVKFTAIAYLIGVAIAILATPMRKHVRGPWLWGGVAVGAALVAPSVAWQFANGLPVLEFVSNQGGGGAVLGLRGRAGYVVSLLIFPGPFALLLTIPGLRFLARERAARPIGIALGVAVAGFFLASGKGYYAAPGIAVLCVAGAILVSTWTRTALRNVGIALIVNLLLPLPMLVPLVPTSFLARSEDLAQATELSERIGWRELAGRVSDIYQVLPTAERSRAIFLGANYTLPSVIEFYSDTDAEPTIAVSGHNSAYLWWPRIPREHVAIAVGFEREELEALYEDVEHVGNVSNVEGVHGYDWGDGIFLAREPRVTPEGLRAAVKHFEA